MPSLMKAVMYISELCKKADVHGVPRLSITFDKISDRERFLVEVKRETDASSLSLRDNTHLDFRECTIYGIRVRIL